jgi:hypothetical protein
MTGALRTDEMRKTVKSAKGNASIDFVVTHGALLKNYLVLAFDNQQLMQMVDWMSSVRRIFGFQRPRLRHPILPQHRTSRVGATTSENCQHATA